MMLLNDLLAPWFHYSGGESINGLTLDSRDVKAGGLFVALPGHKVDGRVFIPQAIQAGAAAILIHTDNSDEHGRVDRLQYTVPLVYFSQLSRQLSAVAAQFYLPNSQSLSLIGITGTNGKTSVSQIIAQIVHLLGHQAAVMGTLGNGLWGQLVDSGNTTADAVTIMRQLGEFVAQGAELCAMEVSSHGLVQGRVEAAPFKIAVFTNLSRDHLDYHGDMDNYAAAKKCLFQFPSVQHGVINLDDTVGAKWLTELANQKNKSFSIQANTTADFYCDAIQYHDAGVTATLHFTDIDSGRPLSGTLSSPLLGAFNLSNLVAAISVLYLQGMAMASILAVLPQLIPVAGRMERFSSVNKATLVVDYAHTPDAIEQALKALKLHCKGTLWCVFGCGGDRDKGKRALMAQAAEQYADKVMITSDNARSEDPQAIINDILQGISQPQNVLTEVDRIQAITHVVSLAQADDIVLLAGKGHETYQEVAGERIDYDERALAFKLSQETL
ncbi:UDP-N-acetylmuramoyl-L-alanyl-D-glutamate--2,6-diaminopimelate ligase [Shewanella psychromarinicola]|uniref:UDP-N-acetylmuramyl-tripeptide synthetase n=1 Tax=Shewanella psychromarinicola TaxID=2487742 RepID=A0A3N4E2B1_9GAMM|nr:UDP-N-acetylmuramoyl-L-alanyl-D-glutamate--2,6-diaminopimelate ligase [Shewanella psychromarinicola]AZG34131.1 UDP-N-acetylmuramoyl-L-alanyl-D-glutamate--2,6-diaminopimelate ligase [Shewanella psychromarinicola]MCL1082812.1 UDP-N-acetylmuramoyl-L-alanyl-D-glutamate--2,6-diaminopimelate ligase [Shewanella psychromarinicola]RPA32223.1 UDP-N-acetylmuramoyl-L-alanyl-D-glutamate--2,6-diaminopimelate ligase [Shewanella psychromarinicola]